MTEGFAAVGLHRPSRPENIGGMFRAADVYGVRLVVLGGGELPPEPLGHPTDTTQAWRRIPLVFADEVLDVLPDECVAVAVERVAEATPLPVFEHPERVMYLFGPVLRGYRGVGSLVCEFVSPGRDQPLGHLGHPSPPSQAFTTGGT